MLPEQVHPPSMQEHGGEERQQPGFGRDIAVGPVDIPLRSRPEVGQHLVEPRLFLGDGFGGQIGARRGGRDHAAEVVGSLKIGPLGGVAHDLLDPLARLAGLLLGDLIGEEEDRERWR